MANSMRVKDEIKRHYELPEEKICVIYNGIDIKAFDLSERDRVRIACRDKLNIKNETALLFVGSGFERKGLKFLIEALGILKRNGCEGIKLIIVGKGNITKYQDMALECGVEMDVQFVGPVKDVKGYYFAADIFVLPSIYEPFSNACLEAMASGLPVIASKTSGVSEIITHDKDGFVINHPINAQEIAHYIHLLLEEEKRGQMGTAARQKAELYSFEANVEKTLRIYQKVLHNS